MMDPLTGISTCLLSMLGYSCALVGLDLVSPVRENLVSMKGALEYFWSIGYAAVIEAFFLSAIRLTLLWAIGCDGCP